MLVSASRTPAPSRSLFHTTKVSSRQGSEDHHCLGWLDTSFLGTAFGRMESHACPCRCHTGSSGFQGWDLICPPLEQVWVSIELPLQVRFVLDCLPSFYSPPSAFFGRHSRGLVATDICKRGQNYVAPTSTSAGVRRTGRCGRCC